MELWDLYTKDRVSLGKTHVRGNPVSKGEYHIVVVVWIVNPDGRILLTKRHPDKPWPNFWECTGGSVVSGENSRNGAVREVKEEIGISLDPEKGRLVHSYTGEDTLYDYWLFIEKIDLGAIVLQDEEVIDKKYVTKEELIGMFETNQIIPHLSCFLDIIKTDAVLSALVR